VFIEHGLTRGSWDVLAALRRAGQPYRVTPTDLYRALMRTSGAITHTLRRLEYAGLVERLLNPEDGRSLYGPGGGPHPLGARCSPRWPPQGGRFQRVAGRADGRAEKDQVLGQELSGPDRNGNP
jgi:DNA-binding transcriptional ArsR family regulator